jgi:hypothetical protein
VIAALALALVAADVPVRVHAEDLAGLVWAAAGTCPPASDLYQRQCRAVQAARAAATRGQVFVVAGDAGALEHGADGSLAVRGCLACVAPPFDLYVTTRGDVAVEADRVRGPRLGAAGAGAHGVDFTVRLDAPVAWSQGGKRGAEVDLVGFTVLGGGSAEAAAPAPAPLPEQPSPAEVRAALAEVAPEVERCHDRYGVPGTVDAWLEVTSAGEVTHVEVHGDLAGTPTASCVAAAAKKAHFPRFQRAPLRLHAPFNLR